MAGPAGHLWQHPGERNQFLDPDHWDTVARLLEDAKFDAIFLADSLVFYDADTIRGGGELYLLDPVPLAMSIARATKHLGIGVTVSTSFVEPYGIARALGTTDLLSGGRIAWNVVTSTIDKAAHCYGMEKLLGREERYDRAEEVLEATVQLWESFGRNALVVDKKKGVYIDPGQLRDFDYVGKHVKTRGPLTTPPSPQGRPIIIQAGASERGRNFAGRWAEMVFASGSTLSELQSFYSDIKHRAASYGRPAHDCAILAGLRVIVGETEAIARDKQAYCNELMSDDVAIGVTSKHIGIDLARFDLDGPMPKIDSEVGSIGIYHNLVKLGQEQRLTLRQVARRYAGFGSGSGIAGSPDQVADYMQKIFDDHGADGFMLNFASGPGGVDDFCRLVIPVLQERGLFRNEYPGTTLRETLGLSPWPVYPPKYPKASGLTA
ncbi:LLM class flavin-dependent oxidoreductase [Rhizobium lusitanum]|uniref:LLM class flavin-dependent oxidoreductase n=1 Tax=Rhizobium lusitanum TaxID=293958 RepID=UPI001FD24D42|nr:LLM class flavin-dependent oxidoreductase [Rhizobium lusitanum]